MLARIVQRATLRKCYPSTVASTTSRRNPGKLRAIVRRAAEYGRTSVRVGWSEETGASPEPATIALYNMLGTDTIPARPVLEPLFAAEKNTIRGLSTKAANRVSRGLDPAPVFDSLAATLETQGKATIRDLKDPRNADSTIAKKGFDDPLVGAGGDGGRLLAEFGARVVKRR